MLTKTLGIKRVTTIIKEGIMESVLRTLAQIKIVESSGRPWGEWIRYETPVCLKTLRVEAGEELSLQRHHFRSELWAVLEGYPRVTADNFTARLAPGDVFWIEPEAIHRLEVEETAVLILEMSFGFYDEADIERLADRYGRAPTEETT